MEKDSEAVTKEKNMVSVWNVLVSPLALTLDRRAYIPSYRDETMTIGPFRFHTRYHFRTIDQRA